MLGFVFYVIYISLVIDSHLYLTHFVSVYFLCTFVLIVIVDDTSIYIFFSFCLPCEVGGWESLFS